MLIDLLAVVGLMMILFGILGVLFCIAECPEHTIWGALLLVCGLLLLLAVTMHTSDYDHEAGHEEIPTIYPYC